ncbi:hypothetical protein GE061_012453 [Apolygus lucorum]|uniref:Ionotropic glutamate receptor C-terminal domain-containing protein n=1 Tax=Apolygus lucorum TaxID=248454 RepID=A0A8S9XV21_APOLU|nr:hypothetical protein GE061_012453 [Apolygus lucorum]
MTTASTLPLNLPSIIIEHFSYTGHCNAYFCNIYDALFFEGDVSSFPTLCKTSVISSTNERIKLDSSQHRLGIFLDTSCIGGLLFLQKNPDVFNSSYKWLLWSQNSAEVLDILEPSHIDIDSDLTLLMEVSTLSMENPPGSSSEPGKAFAMADVHRKHRSLPFIVEEYQLWIGNNLHSTSPVSERDLEGVRFVGSVWLSSMNIANTPRELLMDPAHASNVDVKSRYGMSLFNTLCQHYLNCSLDLIQANCNDDWIPCNGTVSIIDQVSKGEADFGIVPLIWDPLKLEMIDYSLPIMNIKFKYLFLRPKMIGSWFALILPLSSEIWLLLFALLILSVVAFRIVSPYDDVSHHNDGWGGSIFLFVSAMAQQGIPDNAGKLTTRIIYVCVLGVTFFVYVYYSTALLNGLLLPPPNSVSFPEQLFQSHFQIGLESSDILRARMMPNTGRDEELKRSLASTAESDIFMSAATGVEKAVHESFAIFGDESALYQQLWTVSFTFAEMCSVGLVDDEERPRQASFVLRPNSPYKEILRRGIIRSRERGAMERLKTQWFPGFPECLWKTDAIEFGFRPHTVAYIILGIGVAAGAIIFGVEKILFNPKIVDNAKPKSTENIKTHTE